MCSKKQYSKKEAHVILNERKNKHKKWAKETRAYCCNDLNCNNSWHLTSQKEFLEKKEIPLEELFFKDEWLKLQ